MCEDEVGGPKNKKKKNGVIWLCKRWKNKNQVYATSDKCKVAGRKKAKGEFLESGGIMCAKISTKIPQT